jgi:hypothetical protein
MNKILLSATTVLSIMLLAAAAWAGGADCIPCGW